MRHDINFSSAKNVLQIYKRTGRLEKKIQRDRKKGLKSGSKLDPASSDEDEFRLKSNVPAPKLIETGKCGVIL